MELDGGPVKISEVLSRVPHGQLHMPKTNFGIEFIYFTVKDCVQS
jgi:hypothetical protein